MRCGTGGIRSRLRIRRTVEAPTRMPSPSSSPWVLLIAPARVLPRHLLDQAPRAWYRSAACPRGGDKSSASRSASGASAAACPASPADSSSRAWGAAGPGRRSPPGRPSPALAWGAAASTLAQALQPFRGYRRQRSPDLVDAALVVPARTARDTWIPPAAPPWAQTYNDHRVCSVFARLPRYRAALPDISRH